MDDGAAQVVLPAPVAFAYTALDNRGNAIAMWDEERPPFGYEVIRVSTFTIRK